MNPEIQSAREAGLSILRPSAAELEKGIEIHRTALVFEPYGLGLCGPLDAASLNRELASGATAPDLRHLGEEQNVLRWTERPEFLREFHEAWEASGVSAVLVNAGEEGNHPMRMLKRLSRYTQLIDRLPDFLARGTSPSAIREAWRSGRKAIGFATNGVPLPGTQVSVESELSLIRVFAGLGVRAMHLTYNRRNVIGDGCGEKADAGLSDFGSCVVEEMNRAGVLLDLAHSGQQTSLDACRISRRPVMISHATSASLNQHLRAKTDEVVRAVVDTGGVIGVTNVPAFLGRTGDIVAFLDHIDYLVDRFGWQSVAIGTDTPYRSMFSVEQRHLLEPWPRTRPHWEALWPGQSRLSTIGVPSPEGLLSLAWTNFPLFTVGMVQRGHSEEAIRGILGENLLRVFESTAADLEILAPAAV